MCVDSGIMALMFSPHTLSRQGWVGTDSEMQQIADDVDIDGSGSLDQTEWLQLMSSLKEEGKWNLGMALDARRRGGRSGGTR